MRVSIRIVPILACGLAALGLSSCGERSSSPDPSAELEALGQEIWQWGLERNPGLRLREGLPVERLAQLTYEDAEQVAAFAERQATARGGDNTQGQIGNGTTIESHEPPLATPTKVTRPWS